MKIVKRTAVSLAITGVLVSGSAFAELSGNVGATSNYMWRGLTQTAGGAAVSGGVDYTNSGIYAGIWTSNTSFGSPETDFYVGYKGEAGSLSYDLNVISYQYLQLNGADWAEVNANFGFGDITFGLGYTDNFADLDTKATYIQAGYSMGVGKESTLAFHVGSYNFDDEAVAGYDNYVDYSVTLSKGDWSFMYSDTNLDADVFTDGDPVFVVSFKQSVDL